MVEKVIVQRAPHGECGFTFCTTEILSDRFSVHPFLSCLACPEAYTQYTYSSIILAHFWDLASDRLSRSGSVVAREDWAM